MQLQGAVGNRAVVHMLANRPVLTIGDTQDDCEREAERVGQQALTGPAADPGTGPRSATPRRKAGAHHHIAAGPRAIEVAASIRAQQGRGAPLPGAVRAPMESGLGADLRSVRVHQGPAADALTRRLGALAFTSGDDVFFSRGAYRPGSATGDRLLGHELTHTLQQRAGGPSPVPMVQRAPEPGAAAKPLEEERAAPTWAIAESRAAVARDAAHGFTPVIEGKKVVRIPPGTVVDRMGLDREEGGIAYAMVEWRDGARTRIDWVPQADLVEFDDTYATPIDTDGRSRKGRLPFRKDAEPSYVSAQETAALASDELEQYRREAEALLARKALTPNQRALLERARQFVDDGSISTPERMDKIGLDPGLLARIKSFYRFLVKEGLVTGNVVGKGEGTYGARTPQTAHELSTKWMLYTGNKKQDVLALPENRLEFARQLVEIGGNDGVTEWATGKEVALLAQSVQGIHFAIADLDVSARALELAPGAPRFSLDDLWADAKVQSTLDFLAAPAEYQRVFSAKWEMWRQSRDTTEHFQRFLDARRQGAKEEFRRHQLAIDQVVAEIRTRFSAEGVRQDAPALEGYERGSPKRSPNLLDVGKTEHLSGDAADIHFDYKFNYYDPIVDDLALVFGLRRAAINAGEYWHYQAIGQPFAGVPPTDEPITE